MLQCTGEVDAPRQRRHGPADGQVEGIEEVFKTPLYFSDIVGEAEERVVDVLRFAAQAPRQPLSQRLDHACQAVLEQRPDPLVSNFRYREGHAPGAAACVGVQAIEGLVEARQQVDLAEAQIDRGGRAQGVIVAVDSLNQLLGQGEIALTRCLQQLRQVDHHHQTIDRPTLAPLGQQPQEVGEGTRRLILGDIAPGGIDHHGITAEVPVAVLGAGVPRQGGDAGIQPGARQQRGLARGAQPHHQVPGQLGQMGAVPATCLQHPKRRFQALAQNLVVACTAAGGFAINLELEQAL